MDYLLFVTVQTSPLIAALLVDSYIPAAVPELKWPIDIISQLDELFVHRGKFCFSGF